MTRILTIIFISLFLISCGTDSSKTGEYNVNERLIGNWLLISKVQEGKQVAVNEHQILFEFKPDGTFVSRYRYRPVDQWLNAGAGAFIFNPPLLELFWNSGRVVALTVVEKESGILSFHHGRNLAPAPGQEPDEVFKRVSEP